MRQPFKHGSWGWVIVSKLRFILLIATTAVLQGKALAQSEPDPALANMPWPECNAPYCVEVLPSVCVTQAAEMTCEQPLFVRWQSRFLRRPCLYQDNTLLHCWDGARKGEWGGEIDWPKQGTISLTDESGAIVAEVEIAVQSLKPRRRLGSPWSVF